MPISCAINRLAPLFDYLDDLDERVAEDDLRTRMSALDITWEDVADHVRFSDTKYMRNLIHEGPQYHALMLCWRSGQRSPIHNHAQSMCGVRVVAGTATETVFETSPCGLLKPTRTSDAPTGTVLVSSDSDTHQISNLQVAGDDLVSLHIYWPPLLKMDTFSLTNSTVGVFRPSVDEHIHGSGI